MMESDQLCPTILLDSLRQSLDQVGRSGPGEVQPAAILWCDADAQWQPIISHLQKLMPELFALGEYCASERQGPPIWLKCVVERTLPEIQFPQDSIPVLYLPKVSRQTLRSVEECPDNLKPLVELQYRGAVWSQRNGKDWTVEAFLVSGDGGLELDMAKDSQTNRAMLGALPLLATTPLSRLRVKRLEAEDFDHLMVEDTPRDLLHWLADPDAVRATWDDSRWKAFRARCKAEYDFDPEKDGDLVAGEYLGMKKATWRGVWERFIEAPDAYPGVYDLLKKAQPSERIMFVRDAWPAENENDEQALRSALQELATLPSHDARKKIEELENLHGARREWVWAKLGYSPLAVALRYLKTLAQMTSAQLRGENRQAIAGQYAEKGYLVDDAVLRAMVCAKKADDKKAVEAAIRVAYLPWLEDGTLHFQKVCSATPLPDCKSAEQKPIAVDIGTCIVFVDGLRFDLGRRLTEMAGSKGTRYHCESRWAASPTVTSTSKPYSSPIAAQIKGQQISPDFVPEVEALGQPVTPDRFKKLLASSGYQVFALDEIGLPQDPNAMGWSEWGDFDHLGHSLQGKLPYQLEMQLEGLLDRIQALLQAGWKKVRVITDHGWLYMPGGLPAITLPKYLTESRWARCAAIKSTSQVDVPTAPWYWNPEEYFAYAPGIHCFGNGNEYAHGGLSLQECLIPDLTFSMEPGEVTLPVSIKEIQWTRLRCRVLIEPGNPNVTAVLRQKVNDPKTNIAVPKKIDSKGTVSLLVEDESLEGSSASLVILDASGHVLAKKPTIVGGEE